MLKSLELFGFKSFADRTKFDFAEGITCVVGPNGSGKSNVVDAIKWILGEQSPKSLRGKEMTDVIFNGSTARKASSFAEATLIFDNSRGVLPIDSSEVQIGRRIWQSGDAEYLINGAPSRLRDVRELFVGTGTALSAYSIIEQGRVDKILQTNPTARRMVFEEAAGISRYKLRKTESLRKLDRVAQNLLRLTDIVDEVEAQLTSIRTQASKAAKYRALSEELRTWWTGLAADDYRHLTIKLKAIEQTINTLSAQIERQNEFFGKSELQLSALDVDITDVDDRLRQVERENASNRERIASYETTIRHQLARQGELDSEIVRLRKQCAMMAGRLDEVCAELDLTRGQVRSFQHDFELQQQESIARNKQIAELQWQVDSEHEALKKHHVQRLDLMQQISEFNNQIAATQLQLEAITSGKRKASTRHQILDQSRTECQAKCQLFQVEVDRVRGRIEAVDQTIGRIQINQEQLIGEQDQFQSNLAEMRGKKTVWQTRQSVLEDLEHRQEGLSIGVKEILSRATTSDNPPWNRILGSVADLLEVDLEEAALLEVALGHRAQLIVLDDYAPMIDYLNQRSCRISGRVGFIALPQDNSGQSGPNKNINVENLRWCPGRLSDLSQHPGVVNRADRLVTSQATLKQLAEYLLSDTWIVSTLDVAMELATGTGQGCRFVTLQGETIEADGTLIVGSVHGETALLSRKSELRRLKHDLILLESEIETEERTFSGLDKSLCDVDAELKSAESEKLRNYEQFVKVKFELTGRHQELDRLSGEHDELSEEISRMNDHEQELQRTIHATRIDVVGTEESMSRLKTEIENFEREVSCSEQRLQLLRKKQTEEQLKIAKQEERRSSLQHAYERIERETGQRNEQFQEASRRLTMAISKHRQTNLQILNTNAQLAELFLTEEELAKVVATQVEEKETIRSQRATLVDEEARSRQQQRELNDRLHGEEIKARDIRHQMTTIEQRLEEEYQQNLADVVASGVSAFQQYLGEQHSDRAELGASRTEDKSGSSQPSEEGIEYREDEEAQSETSSNSTIQRPIGPDTSGREELKFEDVRRNLEAHVNRLRRKLRLMGSVNTDSLDELDELENRFGHLSNQLQDLVEAKATLEEIVRKINAESKRLFIESFEAIRSHFQELYRRLFGGGEGDIVLEDANDVLECGVDIVARPPGKELKSISLLSGGEKTLTAVALLLAIFKSRPSPFCVLDEVDAALDEANIDRYISVVKDFQEAAQFITITHSKRSMTMADALYGVTMEQSGVSKKMSIHFEDVSENGEFTTTSSGSADDQTLAIKDVA